MWDTSLGEWHVVINHEWSSTRATGDPYSNKKGWVLTQAPRPLGAGIRMLTGRQRIQSSFNYISRRKALSGIQARVAMEVVVGVCAHVRQTRR